MHNSWKLLVACKDIITFTLLIVLHNVFSTDSITPYSMIKKFHNFLEMKTIK